MIRETPRRQHVARWIVAIIAGAVLLSVGLAYAVISTQPMTNWTLVARVNALCAQAQTAPSAKFVVDECGPITTDNVPLFLRTWCGAKIPDLLTSELSPTHARALLNLLAASGRCP